MKSGREKYSRYFLEFGVVFLGVTLAFMFDRIYESYKDYQTEQTYLESFHKEIKRDKDDLDSLIISHQEILDNIFNATDTLKSKDVNSQQAIMLVQSLTMFFQGGLGTTTYESIKATGGFNMISDIMLRNEIVELYLKYEKNKLLENLFYDYTSQYMLPIVANEMEIFLQKFKSDKFYQSSKFWNRIYLSTFFLNESIKQYKETRKMCEKVLESLEEYKS